MAQADVHLGQHPLHSELHEVRPSAVAHAQGQQHPIKLYLVVWGWLFVLSTCSYLVDYFGFHGYLRWSLILLFMVLKAGLIVAVFMHMAWERLALIYAILLPPVAVLVFLAIMMFESDYTPDADGFFGRRTVIGRAAGRQALQDGLPAATAVAGLQDSRCRRRAWLLQWYPRQTG